MWAQRSAVDRGEVAPADGFYHWYCDPRTVRFRSSRNALRKFDSWRPDGEWSPASLSKRQIVLGPWIRINYIELYIVKIIINAVFTFGGWNILRLARLVELCNRSQPGTKQFRIAVRVLKLESFGPNQALDIYFRNVNNIYYTLI